MGPSSSFGEHHEFLGFLQPFLFQLEKQNTRSKGAQERRTGKERVVAKSRPGSLITRSLIANQSPMLGSGTSCSPGTCRLGDSDLTSTSAKKTPPQDSSASNSPGESRVGSDSCFIECQETGSKQDPTAYSQERRQYDTLSSGIRKLVQSGETASSASTRKLVRGDDSQLERKRMEFHNVQISDHRYFERVFKNLRQK